MTWLNVHVLYMNTWDLAYLSHTAHPFLTFIVSFDAILIETTRYVVKHCS